MNAQMDDSHYAYLYAIRRRDTHEVKIGITCDPRSRLGVLQSANGEPLELVFALPCDSRAEADVQRRFGSSRKLGEWFAETPELLAWLDEQAAIAPPIPSDEAPAQPCASTVEGRPCAALGQHNHLEIQIAGAEGPTDLWLCTSHRDALVQQCEAVGVGWRAIHSAGVGWYYTAPRAHRARIREAERAR